MIEVAPFLPLEAISVAATTDKDRTGKTLRSVHKWLLRYLHLSVEH